MSTNERSLSQGRGLRSTGRGGVGNMHPPSFYRAVSGPDDYSDTRGRDPIPAGDPHMVISTGRGGRGNIRAPSRYAAYGDHASIDVSSPLLSNIRGRGYDRELIARIDNARNTGVRSFGRGGAGNVIRLCPSSKYSSRTRELAAHTTEHGGAGNMYYGRPSLAEKEIGELDESGHSSHMHDPGVHSVLRGSYANLTPGKSPQFEGAVKPHMTYRSSGGHVRRLLHLRHRLTGLLRNVGGGSIPKDDHHRGFF